jgi:DNA-binding IscR family transcriptional regulator
LPLQVSTDAAWTGISSSIRAALAQITLADLVGARAGATI